jgi:hypothetical protein
LLLIDDKGHEADSGNPWIARLVAATVTVGLAAYLWVKADVFSIALYGICPIAILVTVGFRTRLANRRAVEEFALLFLGACLSAIPAALYHLANGSLASWVDDTIVTANSLTGLDFFKDANYGHMLILSLQNIGALRHPAAVANGAFWLIALLSPLALGLAILQRFDELRHPLPFIAIFYALVAVHFAIPIYALYPLGLVLAGGLLIAPKGRPRTIVLATLVFAVLVGLGFQAGQPLTRGVDGIIRGDRVALDAEAPAGASLHIDRTDRELYDDLLQFIAGNAGPTDTILAMPMSAELYFLSGHAAPVPFVIAPLGLRSESDVEQAVARIRKARPAVITFKPGDKYTTPHVRSLMDQLKSDYRLCKSGNGYELYAPTCRSGEN